MDVALVEDAEHDVDRDQRREDEERLARIERAWNACAVPAKLPRMRRRQADLRASAASIASTASPSETPGARLNDSVTGGELALVVDRQRASSPARSA